MQQRQRPEASRAVNPTHNGAGGRRTVWLAPVNKYNRISNASRVASYEVLHNSKLQPGQDPGTWLYEMNGARDRLHEHGEVGYHGPTIRGQDCEGSPGREQVRSQLKP